MVFGVCYIFFTIRLYQCLAQRWSKRSGQMLRLSLFVLLVFPTETTGIWILKLYSLCYRHIPSSTSWHIFMELHIKRETDLLTSCRQGSMALSSLEAMWDGQQGNLGVLLRGLARGIIGKVYVAPRIKVGSMPHTSWACVPSTQLPRLSPGS